jgi:D-arabinose 1-dehydrogenase-like Zn-dependent alcohol dehydrogenase
LVAIQGIGGLGHLGVQFANKFGYRVAAHQPRKRKPNAKSMSALVDGLGPNGAMLIVGAGLDSLEVPPIKLLPHKKRLQGWPSGIATDSEDTLRFAELTGVRPIIEKFPLAKVNEAYARMTSGKAQFRVVLTM